MALFVRPALAVIGLFAAMLVADPVVDFITQAFFSMRALSSPRQACSRSTGGLHHVRVVDGRFRHRVVAGAVHDLWPERAA
jgi:hypothetical protein